MLSSKNSVPLKKQAGSAFNSTAGFPLQTTTIPLVCVEVLYAGFPFYLTEY